MSNNIFFKSENERNIWIKLNAERIRNNRLNNKNSNEIGDINTPDTCMWISKNQLVYDEMFSKKPRFSLEELFTLNTYELNEIEKERVLDVLFEKLVGKENIEY